MCDMLNKSQTPVFKYFLLFEWCTVETFA